MDLNKIYCGNSLEVLKTFPNELVDLTVTSPPYYQKDRKYGGISVKWEDGESILGLEKNSDLFIDHLILIFKEVVRITKPAGTIVINIDDTSIDKDYLGIPQDLRQRMRKELHLICYNDVIWQKPAPVPRSRKDFFSPDYEMVYFFAKSTNYYFKQITEPLKEATIKKCKNVVKRAAILEETKSQNYAGMNSKSQLKYSQKVVNGEVTGANMKTVWKISAEYSHLEHVAMFPTELVSRCIRATCPENGITFDPFMGAGSTALTSEHLGRKWIGIELNPEYIKIAEERLKEELKQKRLI